MKYIVITKKHLMIFCSCFIASILAVICSVGVLANSNKKLPIYCVETNEKKIALSLLGLSPNSLEPPIFYPKRPKSLKT